MYYIFLALKLNFNTLPSQIFAGDSKSAKFAMVFFIVNMFVKAISLLYSTIIQIDASKEFDSFKSKQSDDEGDGVEMERKVASLERSILTMGMTKKVKRRISQKIYRIYLAISSHKEMIAISMYLFLLRHRVFLALYHHIPE